MKKISRSLHHFRQPFRVVSIRDEMIQAITPMINEHFPVIHVVPTHPTNK
jgi:hypothetical protein